MYALPPAPSLTPSLPPSLPLSLSFPPPLQAGSEGRPRPQTLFARFFRPYHCGDGRGRRERKLLLNTIGSQFPRGASTNKQTLPPSHCCFEFISPSSQGSHFTTREADIQVASFANAHAPLTHGAAVLKRNTVVLSRAAAGRAKWKDKNDQDGKSQAARPAGRSTRLPM